MVVHLLLLKFSMANIDTNLNVDNLSADVQRPFGQFQLVDLVVRCVLNVVELKIHIE